MSKAMQLVGIILLGIFTLVIINLMNDARSTDELDYYLLQEVTEASMYDAVDYSYYRESGQLKVDRDMFLESFNRRFAQSVANNRSYDIKIVDFNETPPKASIEVTASTIATVKSEVALLTNRVNGIIETIYDDYVYSRGLYKKTMIDDEPPVIIVGDNTVTFKDEDSYLLKYAIVDAGEFNTNNVLGSVKKWTDIHDSVKKYVKEYSTKVDIDSRNKYVVVVDAAGNYCYKSLFDGRPGSSGYLASSGKFMISLWDDNGLASNFDLIKMNYNNGWSIGPFTNPAPETGKAKKCDKGVCASKEMTLANGCYITLAKDDKGQQEIKTNFKAGLGGNVFCKLGIADVSVNGSNNRQIQLTFKGDRQYFLGFIVDKNETLSADTPLAKLWALPEGNILTSQIPINEDGYYLHIKTVAGMINAKLIAPKNTTPVDNGNVKFEKSIAGELKYIQSGQDGKSNSIQINTDDYSELYLDASAIINTNSEADSYTCHSQSGAAYNLVGIVINNDYNNVINVVGQQFGSEPWITPTAELKGNSAKINLKNYKGNIDVKLYYTSNGLYCNSEVSIDYSASMTITGVKK